MALIGRSNFLLYVHPSVPARTLTELIEYAPTNPDKLSCGSGSTIAFLAASQLARATDIKLVHVPYKGDAPAFQDLLAGRIEILFSPTASTLEHAKQARPRVVASLRRSSLCPRGSHCCGSGGANPLDRRDLGHIRPPSHAEERCCEAFPRAELDNARRSSTSTARAPGF